MKIDKVSDTWTRLGREDPLWAVLTTQGTSTGRWDEQEFLRTGVVEIERLVARLDELGVTPRRAAALDFGCGAGRLSHGLTSAGFEHVRGMDVSEPMLEKARELAGPDGCEFTRVDGPGLTGVPDASVDLVYSCRVLQHMAPELAESYIRDFFRVVRPGGVVAFQVPTSPTATPAGLLLRVLPRPVADRLRRGMEMHGTSPERVRDIVASAGGTMVSVDPDDSAGPRWDSRLYVSTRD